MRLAGFDAGLVTVDRHRRGATGRDRRRREGLGHGGRGEDIQRRVGGEARAGVGRRDRSARIVEDARHRRRHGHSHRAGRIGGQRAARERHVVAAPHRRHDAHAARAREARGWCVRRWRGPPGRCRSARLAPVMAVAFGLLMSMVRIEVAPGAIEDGVNVTATAGRCSTFSVAVALAAVHRRLVVGDRAGRIHIGARSRRSSRSP